MAAKVEKFLIAPMEWSIQWAPSGTALKPRQINSASPMVNNARKQNDGEAGRAVADDGIWSGFGFVGFHSDVSSAVWAGRKSSPRRWPLNGPTARGVFGVNGSPGLDRGPLGQAPGSRERRPRNGGGRAPRLT